VVGLSLLLASDAWAAREKDPQRLKYWIKRMWSMDIDCLPDELVAAYVDDFAEDAGMTRVCESNPDKSIVKAVAELEKLGFIPYLLAVPEYNKQKLTKNNKTHIIKNNYC